MKQDILRTCIDPSGVFICALHQPTYKVINLRQTDTSAVLGHDSDGNTIDNKANFPHGNIFINNIGKVWEIPNAFPFWGATYILYEQAEQFSKSPKQFRFTRGNEEPVKSSPLLKDLLNGCLKGADEKIYSLKDLPRTVLLSLAQTSKDQELLKAIAHLACRFELDSNQEPVGIKYENDEQNRPKPVLLDQELFEVVGNNMACPDNYKLAMLLIPGIQGNSPIVGEYAFDPRTHIWEYLRTGSYIPWGHYASNMAHDCVRYRAKELLPEDVTGLRHLYYQRVYTQMALNLNIVKGIFPENFNTLSVSELEFLRRSVVKEVTNRSKKGEDLPYTATLWGWNYGFDFSPSGYRLHASHQQIHQQFALIPPNVKSADMEVAGSKSIPTYAVGDQVTLFAALYKKSYGQPFFRTYLRAIHSNKRLDGKEDLASSLIVYEDKDVMVHIPKAQRSQGEVQIMTTCPVGNVLEADTEVRNSLDHCIKLVIRTLDRLGAQMVTAYEISKRFNNPDKDQRLFYCFLPRLPGSPGAFSERQERWITGHYPEDYAKAFREAMKSVKSD
ncbi:MAG: hypothetical protein R6T90_08090 [Dissulfuribacterales bacterium]